MRLTARDSPLSPPTAFQALTICAIFSNCFILGYTSKILNTAFALTTHEVRRPAAHHAAHRASLRAARFPPLFRC